MHSAFSRFLQLFRAISSQKLYRDGFANAVLNNGMKLYNELCNLSKYSYAMKKGLTKHGLKTWKELRKNISPAETWLSTTTRYASHEKVLWQVMISSATWCVQNKLQPKHQLSPNNRLCNLPLGLFAWLVKEVWKNASTNGGDASQGCWKMPRRETRRPH